jgi:hypothetical protein
MSLKKSSDTIANRTRDLPVCSAVPQPLRHCVLRVTTVQNTHQMKQSQYNQVPSVSHPNIHGTLVLKNLTATHFASFHLTSKQHHFTQITAVPYISLHYVTPSNIKFVGRNLKV